MLHRSPFPSPVRLLAALLFLVALVAAPQPLEAQSGDCPLKVKPRDTVAGYTIRGKRSPSQRCEGMYVGLQSAPLNLQVVSLVKGSLQYDLSRDKLLYVHVPPLPKGMTRDDSVLVQGRGREANLNWALDASVPQGGHLVWDLGEVIVHEKLPSERIGVFGQARASAQGDPLYIPLEVSRNQGVAAAPSASDLELVVRIPGASAARWAFAASDECAAGVGERCHEATRLNADGYFRIAVPRHERGETALAVYWRPRGKPGFSDVPEYLRIYRW